MKHCYRFLLILGFVFNVFPAGAQHYQQYHQRVAEVVGLCTESKFTEAQTLLESQFAQYQAFPEELLLMAFIRHQTGDIAGRAKYLTMVHNSNVIPATIRNKTLRKELKKLRLPPSNFKPSALVDSILQEDQLVRKEEWNTVAGRKHDSLIRDRVRSLITAGKLPSEREVAKLGPLSTYRILLAHFPASDLGWYDSAFTRLVDEGVMRPATVASIMDYRAPRAGSRPEGSPEYHYGFMDDLLVAVPRAMSVSKNIRKEGIAGIGADAAVINARRKQIGMPEKEQNIRNMRYLDEQGIFLY